MNFGPLEFAHHLRRKERRGREPATVQAARAAAAPELAEENILSIISGPHELVRVAAGSHDAVHVVEAVAMPPAETTTNVAIRVRVAGRPHPLVLVLSSHHAVDWQIDLDPGAVVEAVLLAGAGETSVRGAGEVPVASIGGFYAFRRDSLEFRHLEAEVMRCTRRRIGSFQSHCSASHFNIDS
jgi:hypothetical protein